MFKERTNMITLSIIALVSISVVLSDDVVSRSKYKVLAELPKTVDIDALGPTNYEYMSKEVSSYYYLKSSTDPHVFCKELNSDSYHCLELGNVKVCSRCPGYSDVHPVTQPQLYVSDGYADVDSTYYFPTASTVSKIELEDFLVNDTDSKWPWHHTLPKPTHIYGKFIRERSSMSMSKILSYLGKDNLPARVIIGDYELTNPQMLLDILCVHQPGTIQRVLQLINHYREHYYFDDRMRAYWVSRIVYAAFYRNDHVDVFMPVLNRYILYHAAPSVKIDVATHFMIVDEYIKHRSVTELKEYANSYHFEARYRKWVLQCNFPSRLYPAPVPHVHEARLVSRKLNILGVDLPLSRVLVTYIYPDKDDAVGQLETSLNSEDDLDHLLHLLLRITRKYEGNQYYHPVETTFKRLAYTDRAPFYMKVLQETMRFGSLRKKFTDGAAQYIRGETGSHIVKTFLNPEQYASVLYGSRASIFHQKLSELYRVEKIECP